MTLAFSDSLQVPTGSELQTDFKNRQQYCVSKPASGSITFGKALSDARALETRAGPTAVKNVETGRDANPHRAEVDAAAAMANGDPVGALAALISAYDHDRSDPTHLRNIGAILATVSMPQAALAFLAQADKLKGKVQSPMGISEIDSEANNRAYALEQLGRYTQAAGILQPAVNRDPLLAEARTNLGVAELCLGQPAKAAVMFAAGAHRTPVGKTVVEGLPPVEKSQVPAGTYLDVSHGHASSLPYLDYPKSVAEIENDGHTYWISGAPGTTVTHFSDLKTTDENKGSALLRSAHIADMPTVTRDRIFDLMAAAKSPEMGGFKSLQDASAAAADQESKFYISVFLGECGLACQKFAEISKANPGADDCTVLWPQMSDWLTKETKTFAADMQVMDIAYRKEWAASSKWATAVYANISNKKVVHGLTDWLKADKELNMFMLANQIDLWEQGAMYYDPNVNGACTGSLGAGTAPPADTPQTSDSCPTSLTDHGFQFSVGILSVASDCETVSVTVAEEVLGPFARVTVARSGNVTITMGAQAGVSMGPMAVGVEAGVYVTVGSNGITDAGVTANASTSANVGTIQVTVGQAGYTGSFIDSSAAPGQFVE